MKSGKLTPEGFAPHSGKTILQRNLERGGLLRPRIHLPDFPQHPKGETPPNYTVEIVDPEGIEGESAPPTVARVIIPRP